MMRNGLQHLRAFRLAAGLAVLLAAGAAWAGPDGMIRCMGRMADESHVVDGDVTVEYRLYIMETGGFTAYWETDVVHVADGNYSALIGDNPYPGYDFVFATWAVRTNAWLELKVDGTTLEPRERLAGAPFALNARGLSIDPNGNVGVYTLEPQARVHLYDTNTAASSRAFMHIESAHPSTWNDAGVRIRNPANRWDLGVDAYDHNDLPEGAAGLYVADPYQMVMMWTTNGQVAIGAQTPQEALGVVGDITAAGDYGYAPVRTNYVFYEPCDFKYAFTDELKFGDVNTAFIIMNSGSLHLMDASVGDWGGVCPVRLPSGARVTDMRTYYIDASATYNLELQSELYVTARDDIAYAFNLATMGVATSSGSYALSPQYFPATNIVDEAINTDLYTYFIAVTYTPNPSATQNELGFYGVRLEYEIDALRR